jgi:hypothetical protein
MHHRADATRKLLPAVLVCVLIALAAAAAAAAARHERLDAVASVFAMRPVAALCYTPGEKGNPDDFGAWGYVRKPLGKQAAEHLHPLVCAGALAVNDPLLPAWQRAAGVMVLVHEAYHLRRWGGAADEAQVQCNTVRHWKVAARLLGASEPTVAELWPAALAFHYRLTEFTNLWTGERDYYDAGCVVPPLYELPE